MSRLWPWFRKFRALIFTVCILLSLACAIIFSILFLPSWNEYDTYTRTLAVVLISINALSAVLLYLMIIIRFRVWLDAARVSFTLLFEIGAAVYFTLYQSTFPCNDLALATHCKHVTLTVIICTWVISGLLLIYSAWLAVMAHVPRPILLEGIEASTPARPAHSLNSSIDSKVLPPVHEAIYSPVSLYSQGSLARAPSRPFFAKGKGMTFGPNYGGPRRSPTSINSSRSNSIMTRSQSPLPSPAYSPPGVAAPLSAVPRRMRSPNQPVPQSFAGYLPNIPSEPVSRQGSPASVSSFNSTGRDQRYQDHPRVPLGPPSSFGANERARSPPQLPPYLNIHPNQPAAAYLSAPRALRPGTGNASSPPSFDADRFQVGLRQSDRVPTPFTPQFPASPPYSLESRRGDEMEQRGLVPYGYGQSAPYYAQSSEMGRTDTGSA